MDGLVDVITLGNVLELCWIYVPRSYSRAATKSGKRGDEINDGGAVFEIEVAQRAAIRHAFYNFQARFCERRRLKIGDCLVDPMTALFETSIVCLAVSICK